MPKLRSNPVPAQQAVAKSGTGEAAGRRSHPDTGGKTACLRSSV